MLKDKVISYYATDRKRSHYIPELEETVYFMPVTVLEMQKIRTLSNQGKDASAFNVFTIIEKCEDAEGKKVFSVEDKPYLEKMPQDIIVAITNAIYGNAGADGEEKKASGTTDS